jgi:hypothetical protein
MRFDVNLNEKPRNASSANHALAPTIGVQSLSLGRLFCTSVNLVVPVIRGLSSVTTGLLRFFRKSWFFRFANFLRPLRLSIDST